MRARNAGQKYIASAAARQKMFVRHNIAISSHVTTRAEIKHIVFTMHEHASAKNAVVTDRVVGQRG